MSHGWTEEAGARAGPEYVKVLRASGGVAKVRAQRTSKWRCGRCGAVVELPACSAGPHPHAPLKVLDWAGRELASFTGCDEYLAMTVLDL